MTKSKRYLHFDVETNNAGLEYGMSPREFFRLGQYAWNDGEVTLTTDYDEMIAVIREADYVVGHNILNFDLRVLFGKDSMEPLQMALDKKVIDTYVLGSLLKPAPYSYTNSKGHTFYGASAPEQAKKWLSLDNLCYQFDLPGKFGDLQELAKKYNPPKTLVKDLDYGLIPLDDEEFLEYAIQDVIAVRGLFNFFTGEIRRQNYYGAYIWREMVVWAINAQITNNGILVDQESAQERVDELAEERDRIMGWLVEEYNFPTTGKQPWKSNAGKEAILEALAFYEITPDLESWTKTAKGAPSFSGDTMIAVTKGTEAERLGESLAILQGQRSLAQLALESVKEDGKAHPEILCLQRSSRSSILRPGLTIWTAHGPNAIEKRYFIADPGEKLVSLDFSSADARAMAALSGDKAYAVQFEVDENGKPKYDSHNLVGEAAFGKEEYWAGVPEGVSKPPLRDPSKVISHSTNYNIGAKTLAKGMNEACEGAGLELRFSEADAREMIDNFNKQYALLKKFKDRAVREGEMFGYVTNPWGRRMMVDEGRSYTQSPGLHGQSVTREMLYDGLIRVAEQNLECIRWVRFLVHDEAVLCIPKKDLHWGVGFMQSTLSGVFDPQELNPDWGVSQPIEFYMNAGEPSDNWYLASL